MKRSSVLIIISVILGFGLGVNVWVFSGIIKSPGHDAGTQGQPEINELDTSTPDLKQSKRMTAQQSIARTEQPPPPEALERDSTHNSAPEEHTTKQPEINKHLVDNASIPNPTQANSPPVTRVQTEAVTSSKLPQDKQRPYPKILHNWSVRPYQTGCVATLSASGGSSLVDPFNPDKVAIYVYYEAGADTHINQPDWFGFVAPGRGEMSAKLISRQGELISGVTGSTGLSWDKLASLAQRDMELRLTQCDLEANCITHVHIIDISALSTVSISTFNCARNAKSE